MEEITEKDSDLRRLWMEFHQRREETLYVTFLERAQ